MAGLWSEAEGQYHHVITAHDRSNQRKPEVTAENLQATGQPSPYRQRRACKWRQDETRVLGPRVSISQEVILGPLSVPVNISLLSSAY